MNVKTAFNVKRYIFSVLSEEACVWKLIPVEFSANTGVMNRINEHIFHISVQLFFLRLAHSVCLHAIVKTVNFMFKIQYNTSFLEHNIDALYNRFVSGEERRTMKQNPECRSQNGITVSSS